MFVFLGGLYDRGKDLNWKQIKDYDVMGAMGKAGGGRNEVRQILLSFSACLLVSFAVLFFGVFFLFFLSYNLKLTTTTKTTTRRYIGPYVEP